MVFLFFQRESIHRDSIACEMPVSKDKEHAAPAGDVAHSGAWLGADGRLSHFSIMVETPDSIRLYSVPPLPPCRGGAHRPGDESHIRRVIDNVARASLHLQPKRAFSHHRP